MKPPRLLATVAGSRRVVGLLALAAAPHTSAYRRSLGGAGQAGSNRVPFIGRISGRALAPSRYQARFTASDSAGVSPPRTLGFTIVR